MDLSDRIEQTRKSIVTDSYEMSIGEIVNLYKDGDLIISPEYQRLYRWSDSQKKQINRINIALVSYAINIRISNARWKVGTY